MTRLAPTPKKKSVWETTPEKGLLKNRHSRQFYYRYTRNGKQKWVWLETDIYSVAKLRAWDKRKGAAKLRATVPAASAGKATVGQLMDVYLTRTKNNADLRPATIVARETGLKKIRIGMVSVLTRVTARRFGMLSGEDRNNPNCREANSIMNSRCLMLSVLFLLMMWSRPGVADDTVTHAYPTDAVYQYSVPVPDSIEMRAYLWIPPKCKHVRGVVIGIQNMLEEDILGDAEIRQACTDCDLGIVFITPGDDSKDSATLKVHSPYHTFNPGKYVADHVALVLKNLAAESGYPEIETVPMIPTAHSAATPFGWGLVGALPDRIIAFFPCKGWFFGLPAGVPTLHMGSEYGEVGGKDWGESYLKDRDAIMKIRGSGNPNEERLIGESVDIGAGHYEWNPDVGKMVAMFIRKAVAARLPADASAPGLVRLNKIDPASGVLLDPATLGTAADKPVADKDWTGDPKKGLWYFDAEMANAANDYMVQALAKKPQVIDFLDDKGLPASLATGGEAGLGLKWLDDGVTFQVAATFLDKSPTVRLYNGAEVGHSTTGSILYKPGSGCLKQTGPNMFRVWCRRGGYIQQGAPWDPHIIAYHPGDSDYRRADRPGHPWLSLLDRNGTALNKDGAAQTIDFPKIEDQVVGADSIELKATSSAALPVQFWVVSGPVDLEDNNTTLKFLPIPPNSKFPVRVIIGAYQWGRRIDPKVQSTVPMTQEFFIKKTASDPTGAPQQTAATTEVAAPTTP